MIVLDTNIISELLRPAPNKQVEAWLSAQDGENVYFTTVGEAELQYGLALLPAGKRRNALSKAVEEILNEDFQDRILAFDRAAARAYAVMAAALRATGPVKLLVSLTRQKVKKSTMPTPKHVGLSYPIRA